MVVGQIDVRERHPTVIAERTAFVRLGLLRDTTANIRRADHRCIVHSGDGNHDAVAGHSQMSVGVEHRESLCARLALRQELHIAIVQRVCPVPVLIEGQRAVLSFHRNGLRLSFGNRLGHPTIRTLHRQEIQIEYIDIAKRKISARRLLTIFDNAADIPGNGRTIIGPQNPDGNLLLVERPLIVRNANRVVLGHDLAEGQGLRRSIVQRIDPFPGLVDGNTAIAAASRTGDAPALGRSSHIDVMSVELPRGPEHQILDGCSLIAAALGIDFRRIVGSGDADGQRRLIRVLVTVRRRIGKLILNHLAFSQRLNALATVV